MRTSSQTVRPKKFTFDLDAQGGSVNNNGYSDHFPVVAEIEVL